jgi:hypothetical protein
MTAQKIRAGALFEAQKNGDVRVLEGPMVTIPHLDTIRLAYWLTKQYIKGAARRTEAGR